MDEPTALYRIFDESDDLLYIGVSSNPFARLDDHRRHKTWYPTMPRITIRTYPSRERAESEERDAIKTEHPRFNIVHVDEPSDQNLPARVPYRSHSNPKLDGVVSVVRSLETDLVLLFCQNSRCGIQFVGRKGTKFHTEACKKQAARQPTPWQKQRLRTPETPISRVLGERWRGIKKSDADTQVSDSLMSRQTPVSGVPAGSDRPRSRLPEGPIRLDGVWEGHVAEGRELNWEESWRLVTGT